MELQPEIDTKRFIKAKNQMQGVFILKDYTPKHLQLKTHWEQIGQWDQLTQVPKGPMNTMYSHTDYIRCQLQM